MEQNHISEFMLNNFSDIALVFLTAALAWFTYLLWRETEKTRLQNITPQISVIFYPITSVFMGLKIENTGRIDAKNIVIKCLNNNKYKSKEKEFLYSEKLSKEFSYMPVGQSYSFSVGYYETIKNEKFEFDISFSNISQNKNVRYTVCFDMQQLEHSLVDKSEVDKISKSLANIGSLLSSIIKTGTTKGIRVYTLPPEAVEKENLKAEIDYLRFELESLRDKDKE